MISNNLDERSSKLWCIPKYRNLPLTYKSQRGAFITYRAKPGNSTKRILTLLMPEKRYLSQFCLSHLRQIVLTERWQTVQTLIRLLWVYSFSQGQCKKFHICKNPIYRSNIGRDVLPVGLILTVAFLFEFSFLILFHLAYLFHCKTGITPSRMTPNI